MGRGFCCTNFGRADVHKIGKKLLAVGIGDEGEEKSNE